MLQSASNLLIKTYGSSISEYSLIEYSSINGYEQITECRFVQKLRNCGAHPCHRKCSGCGAQPGGGSDGWEDIWTRERSVECCRTAVSQHPSTVCEGQNKRKNNFVRWRSKSSTVCHRHLDQETVEQDPGSGSGVQMPASLACQARTSLRSLRPCTCRTRTGLPQTHAPARGGVSASDPSILDPPTPMPPTVGRT